MEREAVAAPTRPIPGGCPLRMAFLLYHIYTLTQHFTRRINGPCPTSDAAEARS
jgi:hypothetical protein